MEPCAIQNSGSELLKDDLMKAKEKGQTHGNGGLGVGATLDSAAFRKCRMFCLSTGVLWDYSTLSRHNHTHQA